MIVEYLRYEIDAPRQAQFMKDYEAAAVPLMASAHSVSFDMCQCVEDPSQFILRIEWSSAEDHLQGFRKSAEFKEFLPHIRPYIDDIKEMRHYTKRL